MTKDKSKIATDNAKPASPESLAKASSPASPELSEAELGKASGGALGMTNLMPPKPITPIGKQM